MAALLGGLFASCWIVATIAFWIPALCILATGPRESTRAQATFLRWGCPALLAEVVAVRFLA
jgi:hypothetical protein